MVVLRIRGQAGGRRVVWPPGAVKEANTQAPEEAMKGVVFLGDRKLELREFPDPTPGTRT
jgi:hypothetical protein